MQNDFRTVVKVGKFDFSIDTDSEMLFLGSCFSDNIGGRFTMSRMNALVNPFGVVYNPLSVAFLVERAIEGAMCTSDELVFHSNKWQHFDFHGIFSGKEAQSVCEKINSAIQLTHSVLKKANVLFLTFGTSYVYERTDTSDVVANCHKFPSDLFSRYRLEPEEIVGKYKELIVALRMFNPGLKILFTVSPVRHWKDGANGNQVSKSVLFLAVDKLVELFDGVDYFPAYEIVMDELRDYRFYDSRMFNPSEQAIDYIWKRLADALFSPSAKKYIYLTSKIAKARNHRLSESSGPETVSFLKQSLQLVSDVTNQFPGTDLSSDAEYFRNELLKAEQLG
ncbi:GSCFA domain-containing protein [Marinilabilia salmonicolor]|uniref:GSCFA domain-containing protein n=1 Tax=Marinilabilia salmonicolor TaxID=989 RepID=UPI00029A154B|nr:GSCFA domain-containing protein [Marinilabilia salmonicolor]